jgi:hypothetical protein
VKNEPELKLIAYLFTLVFAVLVVVAIATAQTPTSVFPSTDIAYTCTATRGNAPPVEFKFTAAPAPHVDVYFGPPATSGDMQSPIIARVTNTSGVDLLSGSVKLLAANNGLPLTVTASDNVGVVLAILSVDGVNVTQTGNGKDALPQVFYLRWNSTTVALGPHVFRLQVFDKSNNMADRNWSMTR